MASSSRTRSRHSEGVTQANRRFRDRTSSAVSYALTAEAGEHAFHLSPLPYEYGGLEPFIDQETLHWHHDVHHRFYVDRLNEAVRGLQVKGMELEEILSRISRFPVEVRENGGGHWNHTFFWDIMTDQKEDQEMTPEVLSAIERDFTSFEEFKNRFVKAGVNHPGSGWVWLVKTRSGRLEIVTTANQDNPLMDVLGPKRVPILGCDVWEHAYYLKYKAKREDFLRKFFTVVNWSRVGVFFSEESLDVFH